jgi:hypothetical protein
LHSFTYRFFKLCGFVFWHLTARSYEVFAPNREEDEVLCTLDDLPRDAVHGGAAMVLSIKVDYAKAIDLPCTKA